MPKFSLQVKLSYFFREMKKTGKRTQKNEEGLQKELDEKDEILPQPQSQVRFTDDQNPTLMRDIQCDTSF